MRRDPATRGAILELAMQVDLSTGEERLWFGVIRQAVDDLTGTWLRTGKADYPAEQYFGSQKFREDAYACGLEPEYVLDVLRRYNLLREDGSAVREFIAADTEDAAAFLGGHETRSKPAGETTGKRGRLQDTEIGRKIRQHYGSYLAAAQAWDVSVSYVSLRATGRKEMPAWMREDLGYG